MSIACSGFVNMEKSPNFPSAIYNLAYCYNIFALFCQWHWYCPLQTIYDTLYACNCTYIDKKTQNQNTNKKQTKTTKTNKQANKTSKKTKTQNKKLERETVTRALEDKFILIVLCMYVEDELQKCFLCVVAHNRAKWGCKFKIYFKGWVCAAEFPECSRFIPQHSTGSLWQDGVAMASPTLSITSVTCCGHQSFEETFEMQRISSSADQHNSASLYKFSFPTTTGVVHLWGQPVLKNKCK